MMINLRPMNLTMHKNLMTVKRKVLMTSRLLWLQLVNLNDIVHYGWFDGAIIHSTQVLLQKINPFIEGFQRPTLGPVRNFNVVSGEFVQLLHTGHNHWVCVSSIGCLPGTVRLFDSLYHDIISQELEDQVKDLVLAESFQKLEFAPCQE